MDVVDSGSDVIKIDDEEEEGRGKHSSSYYSGFCCSSWCKVD